MSRVDRLPTFAVPASADPTDAALSAAARANAAGGGVVLFPVGDSTLTAPLPIYSNVTYRGAGKRATRLRNATTHMFQAATTATNAGIEDLSAEVQAGGGDWLNITATVGGLTISDAWGWQRNDAGYIIRLTSGGMYDCLIDNTRLHHRTTGTVHPISIVSASNPFSANTFSNLRLEDGPDGFQFINIDTSPSSPAWSNEFRRINVERSKGGMFRLRGCRSVEIAHCVQFDTTELLQHGIDADDCRDVTIRHSFRTSGTRATTARDINLGSGCSSTHIEHCAPQRVAATDAMWNLTGTTGEVSGCDPRNYTVENEFVPAPYSGTAPAFVVPVGESFNVARLGASYANGSADLGAALNQVMADMLQTRNGWASTGTQRIHLPSTLFGAYTNFTVDTAIVVPPNLNLVIEGDGPWGAPLTAGTTLANDLIIDNAKASIGKVFELRNLSLVGGGVRLAGPYRGKLTLAGLNFTQSPVPAIQTVDDDQPGNQVGVVGLDVDGCYFERCAGGVWGLSTTHVLSLIRNCRFLFMDDVSINLDGPGWHIDRNDFQGMLSTVAATTGHIVLQDNVDNASSTRIDRNRFGSESTTYLGNTYNVPRSAIEVGDAANPTDVETATIHVGGMNEFFGLNGGSDGTQAKYAISFHHRPVDCVIEASNMWRNYGTALIGEQYSNAGASTLGGTDRNLWDGWQVASALANVAALFEHGGYPWKHPNLASLT